MKQFYTSEIRTEGSFIFRISLITALSNHKERSKNLNLLICITARKKKNLPVPTIAKYIQCLHNLNKIQTCILAILKRLLILSNFCQRNLVHTPLNEREKMKITNFTTNFMKEFQYTIILSLGPPL